MMIWYVNRTPVHWLHVEAQKWARANGMGRAYLPPLRSLTLNSIRRHPSLEEGELTVARSLVAGTTVLEAAAAIYPYGSPVAWMESQGIIYEQSKRVYRLRRSK